MSPSAPIRVMHVVLSLEPGGLENGVVNVSNALAESGEFEMHICCLQEKGEFAARLHPAVTLHVIGKSSGFSPRCVVVLWKLIGRIQPHVMHTHNLGTLIYTALSSGRVPIFHGEHAQMNSEDLRIKRLLERRIFYRCCRKIHAVSRALIEDLEEAGLPMENSMAISNGVDVARFRPEYGKERARREVLGSEFPGARVLGMVGRFGKFKRHSLLIEAFEIFAAKEPDVRLMLVGDNGPEKNRVLEQVRRSPHNDRIHWTGFREDPLPCYEAMDLLVCPSINEGMSNAILEAMASGVPVLASRACGCEEIISEGEDGILSDADDASSLADDLAGALRSGEELVEMGKKGRKKIEESYSLDGMVAQYAKVYRDLSAS